MPSYITERMLTLEQEAELDSQVAETDTILSDMLAYLEGTDGTYCDDSL
jgi:hypothetical protein